MKRHGNLFPQIVDYDNLYSAYRKARKGEGWQDTIKGFEKETEGNLLRIQDSLVNGTFTTSKYRTLQVFEPKQRTIYVLPFAPDRIVQHAVMNIIEPIWDKMFIDDSYACRKGKGQHKGSRRCMEFVRKYDYCLKADISKFYPSINHNIMFSLVQKTIKCVPTLNIIKNIIYSIGGIANVPIGNYLSQWLGNLYLHTVDTVCKHTLSIKGYIRYCDDFILFQNNKKHLHECLAYIRAFLSDNLKLSMSKDSIFPMKQGVDFLGYRHFRNYILLRKSTAKRVMKRLKRLPVLLRKGIITVEQYISSIQSTKGWLRWCNSRNFSLNNKIDELLMEVKYEKFTKTLEHKEGCACSS